MPTIAAATHPLAYVRFHGRNWRTWNIRNAKSSADRFDYLYTESELAEWVEPLGRLAGEADEVYALFNNNRDDFAPRSAQDHARPARRGRRCRPPGGLEPARDAQLELGSVNVLAVVHGADAPPGSFGEVVARRGDTASTTWSIALRARRRRARSTSTAR